MKFEFESIYHVFDLTDKLENKIVLEKEVDYITYSSTMLFDDYKKLGYPTTINSYVRESCNCENDCCGCICSVQINVHKRKEFVHIVYKIDYNF